MLSPKVINVKPLENHKLLLLLSGNTVEWQGGQDIAPHELYDYSVAINYSQTT